MLSELHIQNFALIENLTLEFDPHLNVLTGETGAGKSILIDALRFVLGERMDSLKAGVSEKTISVEAVFSPGKWILTHELFSPYVGADDEVLVLRREQTSEGRARAWVNARTVNVSTLRELGSLLVDIHGQYDHQLLLDQKTHLDILDRFAGGEELRRDYQALYGEYARLEREKTELEALESGRTRELDILKFEVDEISRAGLKDLGEKETLEAERRRLANAEKLYEAAASIVAMLDEDESSVTSLLGKAGGRLDELVKFDDSLRELKKEFESAETSLSEIARQIADYRERLTFDPGRLLEIESRLDVIHLLERKYGGSIERVLEFYEEARKKYDQSANAAVYANEAREKIRKMLPALEKQAALMTDRRKKAAAKLKKEIESELRDLGIEKARFECRIETSDFSPEGRDRAEFFLEANPGSPMLPLKKIISAGEVSRVMLAMKKVLAKADQVDSLIFDEIDANIGGRLGSVTGEKLREIARERQVLLITHLPQIASFADRHFKVAKRIASGKTVTEYEVMEGAARVKELAEMMSGKSESEISLKHAKEMLSRVGK